jgi:hypothetical protein
MNIRFLWLKKSKLKRQVKILGLELQGTYLPRVPRPKSRVTSQKTQSIGGIMEQRSKIFKI